MEAGLRLLAWSGSPVTSAGCQRVSNQALDEQRVTDGAEAPWPTADKGTPVEIASADGPIWALLEQPLGCHSGAE